MIIDIENTYRHPFIWKAACKDLLNDSPLGLGRTEFEALSDLYINILFHHRNSNIDFSFFELRKENKIVNNVKIIK